MDNAVKALYIRLKNDYSLFPTVHAVFARNAQRRLSFFGRDWGGIRVLHLAPG